jgi:Matrixin
MTAAACAMTLSAVAREAQAYCRTTTCDPQVEHCQTDKNGCTRTGVPLTWRTLPIAYRFTARSSQRLQRDDAREAVRSAFQRWSDVTCPSGRTSLRFQEQDDIAANLPATPHQKGAAHFGIYFRDDAWSATDPDSTLALTTQSFGVVNGWVEQSDIEINTTNTTFATSDAAKGVDLQAVITHEVGHYLGLAHSNHKDSIMVSSYCGDGQRCAKGKVEARRLSEDDEAAVCALFPPGGPTGVLYDEPATASCSAAPTSRSAHGGAGYVSLAAIALALGRWRSRKRLLPSPSGRGAGGEGSA